MNPNLATDKHGKRESIKTRSHAGNMILKKNVPDAASALVKIDEPCLFFTRLGVCKRKETCKYNHTSGRVRICLNYLGLKCDKATCIFNPTH